MRETKKVTLADIVAMEPGYINDSFEAVVSVETKFDPGSGEKYYKAKLHQASNPKIAIAAKFWGDLDLSQLNGKLVEFSGSGLQRTEYKSAKSPRPIQQVSISDKKKSGEQLDNWRIIGESAHADVPAHGIPASTPNNHTRASAGAKPSPEKFGSAPQESDEPVEDRVNTWFKVFEEVCVVGGHDPIATKTNLSPSDLKEITTGIVMSFKAAYGMHAMPHFREAGYSQAAMDKAPDADWGESKVQTWKDVKHPKTGKVLSEIGLEDQLKLVRWAFATPDAKNKAFRGSVLMMAGSIGVGSASACLINSLASHPAYQQDDGFNDQDLDSLLGKRTGQTTGTLTDEAAVGILGDYETFIDDLLALAKDNREAIPF